ncbi:MAG: hypothetical protein ACI8Q1_002069, partial [Parvicella sp.]
MPKTNLKAAKLVLSLPKYRIQIRGVNIIWARVVSLPRLFAS